MGGAAYIIPGSVAPHLVPAPDAPASPSPPRPLWKRLLGWEAAPSAQTSHVVTSPNGDRHFEITPGTLARTLPGDFNAWLAESLQRPSRASGIVLEYLGFSGPSVFVRGLQRSGELAPDFYVQVSFSGCAGEAQVSANVAAHWAACWYRARQREIDEGLLRPFGFSPDTSRDPTEEPALFLPAGDLGYLEFTPPQLRQRYRLPAFDLDHALAESYAGSPALEGLEERFGGLMAEGRCRCQVCEPQLGDVAAPESH